MIEKLVKEIQPLVGKELDRAMAKNPPFHSAHEAYAVIREEVEEGREELDCIEDLLRFIWRDIRLDSVAWERVALLREHAIDCAAEMIQVAAMCDKWTGGEGSEKND